MNGTQNPTLCIKQKKLKIFENFWEQRMKEVGDVQNLTLCNN